MRRITIGLLLASSMGLAVLLTACGGGAVPTQPLTQAAAAQIAATGMVGDQLVIGMISPSGYSPLSIGAQSLGVDGLLPAATSNCPSLSPASPVDADNDGWYATATETYDCSLTSGSTSMSITGTLSESDKNDNDPYSGTKATIKDLKISTTDSSGTSSITENLDWDLTKGTAGAYTLDYDLRFDFTAPSATTMLEVQGTPTYQADSAGDPFAAGTFTFNGKVTFQDSDGRYELTRTSSGAHYSSTCSSGFDGGSVHYADNQGNTLAITFSGCSSYTITYDGSAL